LKKEFKHNKKFSSVGHTVDHITQNLPDPHADARQSESAVLSKKTSRGPRSSRLEKAWSLDGIITTSQAGCNDFFFLLRSQNQATSHRGTAPAKFPKPRTQLLEP